MADDVSQDGGGFFLWCVSAASTRREGQFVSTALSQRTAILVEMLRGREQKKKRRAVRVPGATGSRQIHNIRPFVARTLDGRPTSDCALEGRWLRVYHRPILALKGCTRRRRLLRPFRGSKPKVSPW